MFGKILFVAACMAAAPLGVQVALSAVGFTAAVVAANNIAAAIHSCAGNVTAGSTFAALQSAGAAGLPAQAAVAISATAGAVATPMAMQVDNQDEDE
jgi:Interferon-induced 6-16 family